MEVPREVGEKGGEPKNQKKWVPKVWGPEGWGPEWEAQHFALFFPSPATFFFHSSISWGCSRGILARGPSNVHVWVV